MTEKVDMSLDDIIKLTKGSRRGRGGARGGGGGRGAGGGGRGSRRGGARSLSSPRGGGGGGGPRGRGGVQKRRSGSFGRTRNLNDDVIWQHDLYEGGAGAVRSKPVQAAPRFTNAETHLMVSNLDFAVNDSDIYELFAECGPLKRAVVNYDISGRSLGTAEVVFEKRMDAIKAMKQYNNVPLDGLPMNIELIGGRDDISNGASQTSRGFSARRLQQSTRPAYSDNSRPRRGNNTQRGSSRGTGSARGGRGRGRGRGGRGDSKQVPTAEELDAQLDAYTNKMEIDD